MEGYIFNKCAKFHAIEIHLRVIDHVIQRISTMPVSLHVCEKTCLLCTSLQQSCYVCKSAT